VPSPPEIRHVDVVAQRDVPVRRSRGDEMTDPTCGIIRFVMYDTMAHDVEIAVHDDDKFVLWYVVRVMMPTGRFIAAEIMR
jgi:hypothetical protein